MIRLPASHGFRFKRDLASLVWTQGETASHTEEHTLLPTQKAGVETDVLLGQGRSGPDWEKKRIGPSHLYPSPPPPRGSCASTRVLWAALPSRLWDRFSSNCRACDTQGQQPLPLEYSSDFGLIILCRAGTRL